MPSGIAIEKKFNYFYKIINLINNKFYYGIRSCDCDPSEDPYMGSGVRLHKAYKKYGVENFEKLILKLLPTREDAEDLEAWIVSKELVNDPNCYNISRGGQKAPGLGLVLVKDELTGGNKLISSDEYNKNPGKYTHYNKGKVLCYDVVDRKSKLVSSEEYYSLRGSRYTTEVFSMKSKASRMGKVIVRNIHTNEFLLIDKSDPRYGTEDYVNTVKGYYSHSEETKRKMSESHKGKSPNHSNKGRISVTDGTSNKFIKENEVEEFTKQGFKEGYTVSEAWRASMKSKSPSTLPGFRNITNGIENKRCYSDLESYLNSGWKIGVTSDSDRSHMKGKIAINNSKDMKFINPSEFSYYESLGFKKGRLKSTNSTKGKCKVNNGIENKYIDKCELGSYISLGWNRGWIIQHKKKSGRVYMNNGVKSKLINPEDVPKYELNGWTMGFVKSNGPLGTKHINNGVITKGVPLSEIDEYLSKGWSLGGLPRKK